MHGPEKGGGGSKPCCCAFAFCMPSTRNQTPFVCRMSIPLSKDLLACTYPTTKTPNKKGKRRGTPRLCHIFGYVIVVLHGLLT